MNKKDYKGYELIKAIHDGEIKDGTKIEVHDLKVLDMVLTIIEYSERRLNWENGNWSTGDLFDDNIYFRVLEDNTEEIEELPIHDEDEKKYSVIVLDNRIKINELVRRINYIERKINE